MSPQPTNPAERRTGERERRTTSDRRSGYSRRGAARKWLPRDGEGGRRYGDGTRRRGPADRRSPGGAGLADQSQAGEGGGSAASLVERLAARWEQRVMSPEWPELSGGDGGDVRFFLRAIADELDAEAARIVTTERNAVSYAIANGRITTARYLRTEAER